MRCRRDVRTRRTVPACSRRSPPKLKTSPTTPATQTLTVTGHTNGDRHTGDHRQRLSGRVRIQHRHHERARILVQVPPPQPRRQQDLTARRTVIPASWQTHYTTDLIDLLHVLTLLIAERPAQKTLLDAVLANDQITRTELGTGGALPTITGTNAKPTEFKANQTTPIHGI